MPKTYAIESIELTNWNKIKNGKKIYEWPFVTDINDIIAEEVKYYLYALNILSLSI